MDRPAAAGRRVRPGSPSTRAAADSRAAAVGMPMIGRPRPCARPFAVAMPTRRPVNAPGPVPTTIAAIPRPVDAVVAEQSLQRGEERLAVAVAGRPARHRQRLAGERADPEGDPGRGGIDGQHDLATGRRAHPSASR